MTRRFLPMPKTEEMAMIAVYTETTSAIELFILQYISFRQRIYVAY